MAAGEMQAFPSAHPHDSSMPLCVHQWGSRQHEGKAALGLGLRRAGSDPGSVTGSLWDLSQDTDFAL